MELAKVINPLGRIPSLQLLDGQSQTGSLAICLYVNEKGSAAQAELPEECLRPKADKEAGVT